MLAQWHHHIGLYDYLILVRKPGGTIEATRIDYRRHRITIGASQPLSALAEAVRIAEAHEASHRSPGRSNRLADLG